jgi:peptidoglycan hydrolase CwlO-like protein
VAIYTSGESDSTLDVLVGSRSLADLVEGLEAVARVSEQDTHVLGDVRKFRTQVQRRRAQLKHARARQAQLVAERAASKASIESRLADRQRMLSSIRTEIAQIRAAEQRRQAELERQARARLAEIGEQLHMAEKTASVHVSRILAKLNVRSRTEAAAVAHRQGMAPTG